MMRVDVLMTAVVVSIMLVADVMAAVVDVMAAVVNVMMTAVVVDVMMTAAATVDVMMMAAATVDGMIAAVDLSLVVFVADVDVAHATGLSLRYGFCATGRYKVLGYLCCTCPTGIGDKSVPPPKLHGHRSHGHTAGSVVAFWQRERFEHSRFSSSGSRGGVSSLMTRLSLCCSISTLM